MKTIIKDTLILTAITLIAGALLGLVYEVTKTPIAKQKARAKEEAYMEVFKEADHFDTLSFDEEEMDAYLVEAGYPGQSVNEIMEAKSIDGKSLGYAYTVTSSEGYGGDIIFSLGITNEGKLNGISILTISETAGLGMKANTPEFKDKFKDKTVSEFTVIKGKATKEEDIDALSGATITSKAMVAGVNAGLKAFEHTKGGM
ncbi:MAG TPA: RnfABCDGE type electron transport complex subunit G [Lachnospiraceae bacterium]